MNTMRITAISSAALSLLVIAGCNKEEGTLINSAGTTFQALTENSMTRTVLGDGDSEVLPHTVYWAPGDAIGITASTAFGKYVYRGTENVEIADFEGDPMDGDQFYAIFPYSSTASLRGSVLSLELPAVQRFAPLSFGPSDFPMVARSDSRTLEFKNLCGLLKIDLLGEAVISSITFTAAGADGTPVKVAGAAEVDMEYGTAPELVMAPDAETSVTLDCGEGVALSAYEPTPFYIVLPPGTYAEFTVSVKSADGEVMMKVSHDLVINRSMVRPVSDVEFVPDKTVDNGDREALIAFYNATDGPNWTDNTNWCSDAPLDMWYGVTTNSEGRVTGISLSDNGLSGDAGNTLAPLSKLTYLSCYSNSLIGLDLSANTALTLLYCDNNNLSDLDLSHNQALEELDCSNNSLSELDLSGNVALTDLRCSNNSLSGLDLSNNTALTTLWCDNNNLSALDLSANTALVSLVCTYNNLSALDLSANTALVSLVCTYNNLSDLDLSNNTALTTLWCYSNNLSNLDLSNNTALTTLWCDNNNLSALDLSANTALTTLWCDNNNLSELDLSDKTALTTLSCSNNNLSELDLSANTALTSLSCYGNKLTALDIRNNVNLEGAEVGCQTDADGNYVDMYLYVTEAQLEQWNNSWSGSDLNEYVVVSTRKDYFDISPRSFDVPARGGEITVNISTDLDYTFDIVDSDWITLVSGEGVRVGELVFKVAENPDAAERTGVIQFCGGFNCYNVTVNQAGMDTDDDPSGGNEDVGNDDRYEL